MAASDNTSDGDEESGAPHRRVAPEALQKKSPQTEARGPTRLSSWPPSLTDHVSPDAEDAATRAIRSIAYYPDQHRQPSPSPSLSSTFAPCECFLDHHLRPSPPIVRCPVVMPVHGQIQIRMKIAAVGFMPLPGTVFPTPTPVPNLSAPPAAAHSSPSRMPRPLWLHVCLYPMRPAERKKQ